jgi:hypothetical protein
MIIKSQSARHKKYEVNRTPIEVARQGLRFFKEEHPDFDNLRFCDPAAGDGVWCKAVRELWPNAHITAVEIRREEQRKLSAVADRVLIQPFDPLKWRGKPFDLIATNPPFSLAIDWCRGIFKRQLASYLILLHKTQYFQRSEAGVQFLQGYAPSELYQIGQALNFRDDGSGDAHCYSHFVWHVWRKFGPRHWQSFQLPLLTGKQRSSRYN